MFGGGIMLSSPPHAEDGEHVVHASFELSDEASAALKSTAHTTACTSCDSSLDPMFDDANLTPFDVLLYPPHNPFCAPEDQLLQFASETHPGNVRFLVLLDLHRPFYMEAMNEGDADEMERITSELVRTIVSGTVPGGKFLEWTIQEDAEADYGDEGDDAGCYGQEGSWVDLGKDGQARMLVLRGLRNAPVSSAFDELPAVKRNSMNHGPQPSCATASSSSPPPPQEPVVDKKKKSKLGSSLMRKFKKTSKNKTNGEDLAHSSAKDIAASRASSEAVDSSHSSSTGKRTRRQRSVSDSDSISCYAKQTRRRRLSGLPPMADPDQDDNEPIPGSSLTRSDVLLEPSSSSTASSDGRHSPTNHHIGLSSAAKKRPGNKRFLALIDMYRKSYEAATSAADLDQRHNIVAEIVATVYRGTTEPGRFLREDCGTGKYVEVSCDRAMVTVEHCLNHHA